MIALLLALQLSAFPGGEISICSPGSWVGGQCAYQTRDYGSDDVGRAMAICEKHWRVTGSITITTYPPTTESTGRYDSGWESCQKISEAWNQGEVARKEREAAEQEKRDLDFVNKVAGEKP